MSKFCSNCGEPLSDDAAFCGKCGARAGEENLSAQTAADSTEQEQISDSCPSSCETCGGTQCGQQPAAQTDGFVGKVNTFVGNLKKKDKKAIGITAGVVAALILIVVLVICLSGGGPEKALDTYIDVAFYGKVGKTEKLAPKEYWEYLEDKMGLDLEDAEDWMKTSYKETIRKMEDEYGDDIRISYKITEKDDVKKSTLDTLKDTIKSSYDIPKKNVTDAVELDVEMTVKGDEDEETRDHTFYVVKVDGNWYVCDSDGNFKVS